MIQKVIPTILVIAFFLVGCGSGDDGKDGKDGETTVIGLLSASTAETLDIAIEKVEINSAPVVTFSASDSSGTPIAGLTTSHLRFNIAKLIPEDSSGNPSQWQNYINRKVDDELQGTTESNGTLEDLGAGRYEYTFATDITNPADVVCDAKHDCGYQPSLTHRVAMQISGFPPINPTFDFRPDGGVVSVKREIVKIETCNSCHNKLALHGGGRIDTKYCVTCHNPGSTDPDTGNTVDFKVMIHKIHRGEDLPSVEDGTPYQIVGFRGTVHDYSTVAFPQDIRHCTRCHDGSIAGTPQGDNWKTQVSMAACGSCHDDIDYSKDGSGTPPIDPDGHPGGIVNDNSECVTCHAPGRIGKSVEQAHFLAEPVARQKFQLNILKICGVDVDTDPGPICAPGTNPTVTFSVTDPTNGDAKYAITDPEIAGSNLSFLVAWDTDDYNNTDGTGTRPARADSISIAGATEDTPAGSRIYTTAPAGFVIPDGTGPTGYTARGSGAVGAQGRLAGDFDGDGAYNENGGCTDATPGNGNCLTDERERIFVKNEVEYFRIDDATVNPRRPTVENEKCNQCHDQVSFHGGSRSGEYQVCILCHNPENTDIARRPALPADAIDGKAEESIDFKRMIHGIHAGAQTNYDGSEGHGFREKGLVVYGFGNTAHDYSHMRFPGILNDCETCHEPGAYELDGTWSNPTANGILGSTVDTGGSLDSRVDDLNISPTAAVCSACHDDVIARTHMETLGGALFEDFQSTIDGTIETCSVCHGPGHLADVEVVHGLE